MKARNESNHELPNCVKARRIARGWSQAELARRAGISRAAISGIEIRRLVPSVAAALALGRVLGCRVEELFGPGETAAPLSGWAWPPPRAPWRYWQAEVGERIWAFPVEAAGKSGHAPHDGVGEADVAPDGASSLARQTLVVACCDPAAGMLAAAYRQETGFRMIVVPRSTQQALDLLRRGLVHLAGLHLSTPQDDKRNANAVRATLGGGDTAADSKRSQVDTALPRMPGSGPRSVYKLLRVAAWEEGLAVSRGMAARSVRSVVRGRLRWVAREPGSGARQCLEQLQRRGLNTTQIAYDHWTVAEAIRCGWADAGVCLRLTCEEAGLTFFPVQNEHYELCYAAEQEGDPRIQSLLRMLRTSTYRRQIAELPGYDSSETGHTELVNGR